MADKRTWLDGPNIPGENDFDTPGKWPGERLGLPEKGTGALAPVSRRAFAILIDWIACMLLASTIAHFTDLLGGAAFLGYLLWAVVGVIGGWLFARTPGMALLGMGIARLDEPGAPVGLWRAIVRTGLTSFLFPAALVDMDGRGMHDRATGTVVIYA
ncbi:membrane protein [Corynebacterium phocae]|uniref:Membrane protein n=1 Tax=Corynebacterium phocae TaxID=161895 RepID=A0A1L7D212_9CORY|nr:RDD family protein [Corynebacterium phocae]APT92185.1 membrane protein [Corynebacterium phocae]KAA8725763.1 RDD family protein [Corynebacterium phocae]